MAPSRVVFACRNCTFTLVASDGKERIPDGTPQDKPTPAFVAAAHGKETGHQVERFVFA